MESIKKNYEIKGMSCGGCVSNVKRMLLQVPDIIEADVQLNTHSAVLTMTRQVDTEELQAQLTEGGNYMIEEKSGTGSNPPNEFKKGSDGTIGSSISSALDNVKAKSGSTLNNEGTNVDYNEER